MATNKPMNNIGSYASNRSRPHARSQKGGAGTILQMPVKDEYSHVQDALQYAALAVRRWLEKKEGRVLTRRS